VACFVFTESIHPYPFEKTVPSGQRGPRKRTVHELTLLPLNVIYSTMGLIWDPSKEKEASRGTDISLPEIADLLMAGRYLAILESSSRPAQKLFVLPYHRYTQVVPFVIDAENNIVLRTGHFRAGNSISCTENVMKRRLDKAEQAIERRAASFRPVSTTSGAKSPDSLTRARKSRNINIRLFGGDWLLS